MLRLKLQVDLPQRVFFFQINIHIFFIRKIFIKNEPQKPQNHMKMLRKSPASIA